MNLSERYTLSHVNVNSPQSFSLPVTSAVLPETSGLQPAKSLPTLSTLNYAASHSIVTPTRSFHTIPTARGNHQNSELSLYGEVKTVIITALPLMLTYISEWIPVYVGYIQIGHLPNSAMWLSGVGLAKVFSNVTGLSIVWGLTSALYTLVPQATNEKDNNLLRIYIQRAFYLTTIISLPLLVLQYFCADILIAIGEPSELRYIMNISCYLFIPNIYFKCWLSILRRLTQSLDYRSHSMVASLIFAVLSYPLTYFLIDVLKLGFMTIPIAINFYTLMNLCATISILIYSGHLKQLHLFKPVALSVIFHSKGIIQYFQLALPGIFMSSFEWWMYEIALVLAGFIKQEPNIAVSILIISNTLHMISCVIGGGIGTAVNIYVGKYIGNNDEKAAKLCITAGRIVSVGLALIIFTIFSMFRARIPYIFTDNKDIINGTSYIIYLLIIKQFFVILLQSAVGVFRAIGKPKFSAKIMFSYYYFVALPSILILLFMMGYNSHLISGTIVIFGMLALANIFGSVCMQLYITYGIDWKSVLIEAKLRLQERIQRTCSETKSMLQSSSELIDANNTNNKQIISHYGSINIKVTNLYRTSSG